MAVQCSGCTKQTLFSSCSNVEKQILYENKLIKVLTNWETANIYCVCLVEETVLLLKDHKRSSSSRSGQM